MASSRPRPQDPVNGGWSDVALSRPSSPPPAYSSPPVESVDIAVGTTTNTVDAFHFAHVSDEEEDDDDDSISSDVIAEFNRLDEQLRRQRAPVVRPVPVPDEPFPFMKLPQELREHVYDEYFNAQDRLEEYEIGDGLGGRYEFEFSLLRTSKQIRHEALRSWRKNIFVRIETPWPHAGTNLIWEDLAHVPIVAHGPKATSFTQYTGLVQITAPLHGVTIPEHTIILLLEDLPKFTKVWYYSALNYTNLNPQICLTFTLRDPVSPESPKPAPLPLQRNLLLPFGDVKDLYQTTFINYDSAPIATLRALMATPYPTVQQSCELATTLLEDGDLLLATGNPSLALTTYIASFDAIHIKISGRRRKVLADGHFADDIMAGRYAGQAAMTIRVVLRIRLVARMIHTYLHLSRPDEAAFWGVRSIRLMRQGASPDTSSMEDFFSEFIGGSDLACIYAWTAAALTLMEGDERYKEEWEEYGWEEGGMGDPEVMWRRAGGYLRGEKYGGERRRIMAECGRWGVSVPRGLFQEGDGEVDSLGHLDLGEVEGEGGAV